MVVERDSMTFYQWLCRYGFCLYLFYCIYAEQETRVSYWDIPPFQSLKLDNSGLFQCLTCIAGVVMAYMITHCDEKGNSNLHPTYMHLHQLYSC